MKPTGDYEKDYEIAHIAGTHVANQYVANKGLDAWDAEAFRLAAVTINDILDAWGYDETGNKP